MKSKVFYLLLLTAFLHFTTFGQSKKHNDNIYMTWNATTPETEMNDDIKALSEHGITISYSDVKRNDKGEIIAIKVDYIDVSGSKGSLSLDNKKPINTIKIFKQDGEVGFGEPSESNYMSGNGWVNGFNPNYMMKGFQFNGNEDGLPGQQFNFDFPNGDSSGESNSKIIIKRDNKNPLVIENGKIIEGGDDYSKQELDDIMKENESSFYGNKEFEPFNYKGNQDHSEQIEKIQKQLNELMEKQNLSPNNDLQQSKEELDKAKKELEEAKKELKKTKSSIKTQKA